MASKSLTMLKMVPTLFADITLILKLLVFWWRQILYLRSRGSFFQQAALGLFYYNLLHRMRNHGLKAAYRAGARRRWRRMIFVFFDDAPNLSIERLRLGFVLCKICLIYIR